MYTYKYILVHNSTELEEMYWSLTLPPRWRHLSLLRSAGRSGQTGWKKVRGHLVEGGRSLVAFALGLLLASLYGVTAVFLQKQPLWSCVYSTLLVATVAAFSMGLSASVRADVMVLLPSLCSGESVTFSGHLSDSTWSSVPQTDTNGCITSLVFLVSSLLT